ncbi:unnamed protein product [Larinioides sclopetarius]|uniref:Uncharacterized protein n=1 Tax=Larinioides sclopetarius TaxID=280406 RepID=A0AAV2BBT1_9ARAC
MNFSWKLGETVCDDWTWDEIQSCNPRATSWDWESMKKGKLHPLPEQCVKILILGSPEVGKSTLLWSYFDECDGPTVSLTASYDNCELHMHNMEENGVDVRVYFCDTSQVQNFLQLNEEVYRETSVVIYCYAIGDLKSLNDLLDSWIPLSRCFLGNVPSILVGNMTDLRDDSELHDMFLITTEVGEYVKSVCGINRFYECSIEDAETPVDIFQTALRLALRIEN